MSIEANKALARRAIEEIWNQGKLDVIDEITTEDFVLHDMGQDIRGREAYKQYVANVRRAFPNFHSTVDDLVAEGNVVVTRWWFQGTHQGEIMLCGEVLTPTGRQVMIRGVTWNRFAGDRIAEAWVYRERVRDQIV